MNKLLFLFIISISFTQECGENSYLDYCGTMCPPTCLDPFPYCLDVCVEPMCLCEEGFVFDLNGNCVMITDCINICSDIIGDLDYNFELNIMDVVMLINGIIFNSCNVCHDINYDYNCDVMDIMFLINFILYEENY
tara:strand:- start:53 stop:460 length:408 start_codon:yes stop_codon:yes gene_type:complete